MKQTKVRMLCSIAGPGYSYAPGDVCEFDAVTAARLIDKRAAEPVRGKPEAAAKRGAAPR